MFMSGTTKTAALEDFAGSRCTRRNLHCYRGKQAIKENSVSRTVEKEEQMSSEVRPKKGSAAPEVLEGQLLLF